MTEGSRDVDDPPTPPLTHDRSNTRIHTRTHGDTDIHTGRPLSHNDCKAETRAFRRGRKPTTRIQTTFDSKLTPLRQSKP
jgi:hypothetical protein